MELQKWWVKSKILWSSLFLLLITLQPYSEAIAKLLPLTEDNRSTLLLVFTIAIALFRAFGGTQPALTTKKKANSSEE